MRRAQCVVLLVGINADPRKMNNNAQSAMDVVKNLKSFGKKVKAQ